MHFDHVQTQWYTSTSGIVLQNPISVTLACLFKIGDCHRQSCVLQHIIQLANLWKHDRNQ